MVHTSPAVFCFMPLTSFLKTHVGAGRARLHQRCLYGQKQHEDKLVCVAILLNCFVKEPNWQFQLQMYTREETGSQIIRCINTEVAAETPLEYTNLTGKFTRYTTL